MKRHILVLVLAIASQACAQGLVDNLPRPAAAFPSPVDYYGVPRPGFDPSGTSYRPTTTGVMVDSAGAARPTALPLAYDSVGYANGYGGVYGGAYDSYYTRPPMYGSTVGGSYFYPETFARVPMPQIPAPGVVVPFMPVSTVSVAPAAYPFAPSGSVNFPVASTTPVTYPVQFNPVIPAPVPSSNTAPVYSGVSSNLPVGNSMFPSNFGNGGNVPGVANLPNLPNLPVGTGNLQLGSGAHPLNPGNGVFGGSSSSVIPNGSFVQSA